MCNCNAIASLRTDDTRAQRGSQTRRRPHRFPWLVLFSFWVLLWPPAWGGQESAAGEARPRGHAIWKDAQSKQVLFTVDDVLAFDWEDQIFLLDLDAALDFIAWMVPHKYQTRELMVEMDGDAIYQARWVNPISSRAFEGPVYASSGWTQFFRIEKGYPGFPTVDPNEDVRFDPRLHVALRDARVLCDLDPNGIDHTAFGIECIQRGWYTWADDLKTRVDYFCDVFRSGQDARVHIFFAAGELAGPSFDSLAVEIKFVANRGQYRSDIHIDDIPPSVLSDGIHVCRFKPWTPCPGSVPTVESGSGRISVSVLLCRDTQLGPEVLRRLDLPEELVNVIAPMPSASKDAAP